MKTKWTKKQIKKPVQPPCLHDGKINEVLEDEEILYICEKCSKTLEVKTTKNE
jgi:hypothetical protein